MEILRGDGQSPKDPVVGRLKSLLSEEQWTYVCQTVAWVQKALDNGGEAADLYAAKLSNDRPRTMGNIPVRDARVEGFTPDTATSSAWAGNERDFGLRQGRGIDRTRKRGADGPRRITGQRDLALLRVIARDFRAALPKGVEAEPEIQALLANGIVLVSANKADSITKLANETLLEICRNVSDSKLQDLAVTLLKKRSDRGDRTVKHVAADAMLAHTRHQDKQQITNIVDIMAAIREAADLKIVVLSPELAAQCVRSGRGPKGAAPVVLVESRFAHAEMNLMYALALSGYKGRTVLQGTKRLCTGCFQSAAALRHAKFNLDIGGATCGTKYQETDEGLIAICQVLQMNPRRISYDVAVSILEGEVMTDGALLTDSESEGDVFEQGTPLERLRASRKPTAPKKVGGLVENRPGRRQQKDLCWRIATNSGYEETADIDGKSTQWEWSWTTSFGPVSIAFWMDSKTQMLYAEIKIPEDLCIVTGGSVVLKGSGSLEIASKSMYFIYLTAGDQRTRLGSFKADRINRAALKVKFNADDRARLADPAPQLSSGARTTNKSLGITQTYTRLDRYLKGEPEHPKYFPLTDGVLKLGGGLISFTRKGAAIEWRLGDSAGGATVILVDGNAEDMMDRSGVLLDHQSLVVVVPSGASGFLKYTYSTSSAPASGTGSTGLTLSASAKSPGGPQLHWTRARRDSSGSWSEESGSKPLGQFSIFGFPVALKRGSVWVTVPSERRLSCKINGRRIDTSIPNHLLEKGCEFVWEKSPTERIALAVGGPPKSLVESRPAETTNADALGRGSAVRASAVATVAGRVKTPVASDQRVVLASSRLVNGKWTERPTDQTVALERSAKAVGKRFLVWLGKDGKAYFGKGADNMNGCSVRRGGGPTESLAGMTAQEERELSADVVLTWMVGDTKWTARLESASNAQPNSTANDTEDESAPRQGTKTKSSDLLSSAGLHPAKRPRTAPSKVQLKGTRGGEAATTSDRMPYNKTLGPGASLGLPVEARIVQLGEMLLLEWDPQGTEVTLNNKVVATPAVLESGQLLHIREIESGTTVSAKVTLS